MTGNRIRFRKGEERDDGVPPSGRAEEGVRPGSQLSICSWWEEVTVRLIDDQSDLLLATKGGEVCMGIGDKK